MTSLRFHTEIAHRTQNLFIIKFTRKPRKNSKLNKHTSLIDGSFFDTAVNVY